MNRLVLVVAVGMVVVALSWGLSIVGGPSGARAEKADAERARDLQVLRSYLACKRGDAVLPQSLDDRDYCAGHRGGLSLNDPVTDEAYIYKRLSDDRFEVCAQFARAPDRRQGQMLGLDIVFDGQIGCISGRRQSE